MFKTAIAIFFVTLFMAMIVTPTVAVLLDLDYDVSILVDTSEEEEKEGKESAKDKDVKILQIFKNNINAFDSYLASISSVYPDSYTSNYQKLISPPPEHILTI